MAFNLPQVQQREYNAYVFNSTTETVGFESKNQYSADGRTVIHQTLTISLKTRIQADPNQTLDATMERIRRQLMKPAAPFLFANCGIGNLAINTGDGVQDVEWGPKPTGYKWRPIGSNNVAELVWTVEVRIPDCDDAVYAFALMEVNYKLSFSRDRSGYTTRTYSGFIRVPQTRSNPDSRQLNDNADNYFEQIVPTCPNGFRRAQCDHNLDDSKCRLDFMVVDEEMPPNAPPPGIIEVDANHHIRSSGPGTLKWSGVLSATYEVARDVARDLAFDYFVQLLESRLRVTQQNAVLFSDPSNNISTSAVNAMGGAISGFFNPGGTQSGAGATVLITGLELAEPEIHGRKAASCTATYTFSCSLRAILAASGLWQPVPNSNYAQWKASLNKSAFNPRGNAGLFFANSEDAIIDLCREGDAASMRTGRPPVQPSPPKKKVILQNRPPSPQGSWLQYLSAILVEQQDGTMEHVLLSKDEIKPITLSSQSSLSTIDPLSIDRVFGINAQKMTSVTTPVTIGYQQIPGQTASSIQYRSKPTFAVTLLGQALRAGYYIAQPVLTSIGGVPAVPQNRKGIEGFIQGVVADWYGVPIVAAKWRLRYVLPDIIKGGIGVPDNPLLGMD